MYRQCYCLWDGRNGLDERTAANFLQTIHDMQKKPLFLILLFASHFSFSQGQFNVTYEQLKEFEGLYEYSNHTTLKIAASPKDTSLYAIINESRYRLTPSDKDVFLNLSKENVQIF
jgi:hypothetical protein